MATNLVPAGSERLTDLSNATAYDGLLKDVYLPGLTDTVFNDSSFTALIQQTTEGIDYEGQQIVKGFKDQRAGGVGPIAEGGDFVDSVTAKGKQGTEQLKYLNAYFQITGPTIRAAKIGKGSFVSAAEDAFSDMMINAKNDMERQITGNGTGQIAKPNATSALPLKDDGDFNDHATGLDVQISVDDGGFFPSQFFRKGMKIDIWDDDQAKLKNSTDGTPTNRIELTVSSVAKNGLDIGIDYDSAATWSTSTGTKGLEATDIITVQNAYTGVSGTCLEMNGLQGLVDDTNTSWGLSRTTFPFLSSIIEALAGDELTEEFLLQQMINLQYQHQADPNLLLVSPKAMLVYFQNSVGTGISAGNIRRFNVNQAMEWTGGYTGMGIQLGTKNLMLSSVGSIRTNADANTAEGYMINTSDFAFASMTQGYEWVNDGGRILTQKEASDNLFASAVNYLNMVCYDPGRQMKMTGISTVAA